MIKILKPDNYYNFTINKYKFYYKTLCALCVILCALCGYTKESTKNTKGKKRLAY